MDREDKSPTFLNINVHTSEAFDEFSFRTTTNIYTRDIVMARINLAMNDFHPDVVGEEDIKKYVESRLGYALKNCKTNIPTIPASKHESYFTENFFGLAFSLDMLDKILANKDISKEEKSILISQVTCIDNCIKTLAGKHAIPTVNNERRVSIDTICNYAIQGIKNLSPRFETSDECNKLLTLFLKIRNSLNQLISEIYEPKEKIFKLVDKGCVAISVRLIESDIKCFTRLQNEILESDRLSKIIPLKKYIDIIGLMNVMNLFEASTAIFNCITSYINELVLIDSASYGNLCMSITSFANVASCLIFFSFPKKDLEGHIEVLKRKGSSDIVPLPSFSLLDLPEERYFDISEKYTNFLAHKAAAALPITAEKNKHTQKQKYKVLKVLATLMLCCAFVIAIVIIIRLQLKK